ncbi:CarD family transcriptional regulator [Eubacteriales bacterium OttesenSCG-928-M02]|nr:CarD family transcriptional regulator [Eubacteriales bacterium OttesenSCG-928-M02]
MYEIGEYIIYGNEGVCQVESIGRPEFSIKKDVDYYTLKPLYQPGKIYAPVDTATFMRPVISEEEAKSLIAQIPHIKEDFCREKDVRALTDHYEKSLQTHRCEDLIQLIKTVFLKQHADMENGKKVSQTDERYMKKAEDTLYGEFSVVLDIPLEEVRAYITREVEGGHGQA